MQLDFATGIQAVMEDPFVLKQITIPLMAVQILIIFYMRG